MSKILKDTFSGLFNVGSVFVKKKMLSVDSGARFSTNKETRSFFSSQNKGVLVDGNDFRLTAKDSFEHIAVIAKPGSGKTTAYIVPNVLELADGKNSIVVNDPSHEVFELTSGYLQKKGFKVLRLNPENLKNTSHFNPFDGLDARHPIEIEQICASVILSKYGNDKDPLWNDGAISILQILAMCLAYSQPHNLNLPTLNSLIQQIKEDGTGLNDWVAENSINPLNTSDESLVRAWAGLINSNEKMLSSYVTICRTALNQLNNPNVKALLSSNDVFFNNFRKEKTIIYLNFGEAQQAYYQFIIDVFYSRLFSAFMANKPSRGELDLYCLLDEFGNAYINNFEVIINNVRKYHVSLSLVLQGISQLSDKYGEVKARAVKSGIGSTLIFQGCDHGTANEYSAIMGQKTTAQRNHFDDVVTHYSQQSLLAPDEIRTMNDDQAVFISKNRHPVIINYLPFYQNGKYIRRTKHKQASTDNRSSNGSVSLNFDSKLKL